MQIIVKRGGNEKERRSAEAKQQTLRHYYNREIRDGSRFRHKAGYSKEAIKKVLS
jgi:hypothetical protein